MAQIGHNKPPKKEVIRQNIDTLETEIINWLDGEPVQNDAQMEAVDNLLASVKELDRQIKAEKEIEFRPHKIAADAVIAEFKPDLDKLSGWVKGLLSIVNDHKVEQQRLRDVIAAEAARKAAEAQRAAQEADAAADYGNLAERRKADEAGLKARKASMEAQHAKQDKVTGLRTRKVTEVEDYTEVLRFMWKTDPDALRDVADDWVKAYFRTNGILPTGCKLRVERYAVGR
jgi:hypothetical protein